MICKNHLLLRRTTETSRRRNWCPDNIWHVWSWTGGKRCLKRKQKLQSV